MPIDVGHLHFASLIDATNYIREILWNHKPGDRVDEPQSIMDLTALINRHPEAGQKIGVGLRAFFVDKDESGSRCFWLERTDGSRTDFSFHACIKGQPRSVEKEFSKACRQAIRADLKKAKETHFEIHGNQLGQVSCELTGKMITIEEAHLDHMPPMTFQVIVESFLTANAIVPNQSMLTEMKDAQFSTIFTDKELERNFQIYHHKIARLRILAASENLRTGPQHRIRDAQRPVLV